MFLIEAIRIVGMEAVEPSTETLSSFKISSLSRVTSSSLDSRKHWYVVTKDICGTRPTDFSKNEIFRRFPDELRSVVARELLPAKSANSAKFNRMPSTLYVASSFGLIGGLLRQKDFPPDGLVNSPAFKRVVSQLNSMVLDLEVHDAKDFPSGGETLPSQTCYEQLGTELAEKKAKIDSLELELKSLQKQISDLHSNMKTSLSDSFSSDPGSPCCSSTPSRSPSSSCSSIENTKNSPSLGSTTKKRKVLSKCREVMSHLSDVSEKYQESMACVLGNSFVFGCDDEKEEVRNIISEVVDLVMASKGAKKGLSELLSSETHAHLFKSMRVPDWVLLYFKLQTRLPDSAWQTMLNLTGLGKGRGVSCVQ